jgi:RNA polymerase sigma-70 factor, ECF subfamily
VSEDDFENHRGRLFGVAYRMLGSRAEAEDAVQEAWLRYQRATAEGGAPIADPAGWLVTVVGRICLDVLRSARVRRESYIGPWLPEPLVTRLADEHQPDPADVVARHSDVGLALLVVLDRLPPEQRVAFVLHDAFDVPFEAIAEALGTTAANARQLASRARRVVRDEHDPRTKPVASEAEQRRVLAAFLRAAHVGDLPALAKVLAPDVELVGDGGGLAPAIRVPMQGFDRVSRFILGLFRVADHAPGTLAELVDVNGAYGLLVEGSGQRLIIAPVIQDGQIVAFYHILNPEKLTTAGHPDPQRATWPPTVDPA